MRSAKEIYESNVQYERCDVSETLKKSILGAIITAQKEAIEECAERAKIVYSPTGNFKVSDYYVDKESIISLIKELK